MPSPTFLKTIEDVVEGRLTKLHTMLPGEVVKVDVKKGKCDVKPSIMRLGIDGNPVALPVISNCPIGYYRAGKAAIYLPVAVGDKVEIRFCERSIDTWLEKGGTVDPEDRRKFNLSDAVAYPGMYPFSDPPKDADPKNVVIVNDTAKVTLTPDGKFKFDGVGGELLSFIEQFMTDVIAAKVFDPLTGPAVFTPDTITALTADKAKITAMKGS